VPGFPAGPALRKSLKPDSFFAGRNEYGTTPQTSRGFVVVVAIGIDIFLSISIPIPISI